jgi:hypothetical protein
LAASSTLILSSIARLSGKTGLGRRLNLSIVVYMIILINAVLLTFLPLRVPFSFASLALFLAQT